MRDDEAQLTDGRRAQFWYGGADRGPTVLFFHGCPDTRWAAHTGDTAARDLGVRLLCVNRQGYGHSDAHPSSHASAAADALAVADLLGIDTVMALGMSVGGAYAVACAATHPDRVASLGVIATLPPPARAEDDSVEAYMERNRPSYEEFVAGIGPEDPNDESLAARWLAALPRQDAEVLSAVVTAPGLAVSVREALADPRGYLRDAALTFRPWEVDVAAVRCRTHLWYGALDERARPGGDWLAARIPDARLVVRPGATHLATLLAHWPDVLATLLD